MDIRSCPCAWIERAKTLGRNEEAPGGARETAPVGALARSARAAELPQQATLAREDSASLHWIKTVGTKCRVGVYEVLAECPGRAAWPRITSIPYKR